MITPDNSILLTGKLGLPTDSSSLSNGFSVWKINPAGQLDTSFGNAGAAFLPATTPSSGKLIYRSASGKILVAGNLNGKPALVRFQANGKKDSVYGSSGVALLPTDSTLSDLAVQTDDKAISLAGDLYRTKGGALSLFAALGLVLLRRRQSGKHSKLKHKTINI